MASGCDAGSMGLRAGGTAAGGDFSRPVRNTRMRDRSVRRVVDGCGFGGNRGLFLGEANLIRGAPAAGTAAILLLVVGWSP